MEPCPKYIYEKVNYILLVQDVKLLIEDIGQLKPTIFCAVPRVLDRVYAGKSENNFPQQILNAYK